MSMDDVLRELEYFLPVLNGFNSKLQSSITELEAKHDYVSPNWQDEMRKTYDTIWEPLHETINHYIQYEAPAYEIFLSEKIQALRGYLYG